MVKFADKVKKTVNALTSYYIAHVGVLVAGGAYLANHTGALLKILHGNQPLVDQISGVCELAGFLAVVTPNVANHVSDAMSKGS